MIFNTKAAQRNAGQKLTDISLTNGKLNELWSELDETSQAAVSGGNICRNSSWGDPLLVENTAFINNH
ncbi:hypothetical protein QUB33_03140 [Microcoleus sp. B3-A4]|uniref:hypothetical protein n=1 Tax=Microcoleus sp. B3-A4 TaxID=2818653 RepID=UPI002FD201A3